MVPAFSPQWWTVSLLCQVVPQSGVTVAQSRVGPRARGRRTEHSPPGGCRSGELLPSTRSATGELETSDYNYNTVINMSTTGSPTDWRVEKSNTSPHRVGGVLYEPKAFAIAPSFTNANAPFALPAMLGGAMSLFTPTSLEAGGGARKIF